MIDRVLGIVGIALAVLSLIMPYKWPKVPVAVTNGGLYLAIALIGIAIGLYWGSKREKPEEETTDHAALFLQFTDDHTVPTEVRQKNIQSWYAIYTESIYVDTKNGAGASMGGFSVPPRWTVFLVFKKRTIYRQLLAECRGPKSPKCSVQTNNDRYAIITIAGSPELATLDITTLRNDQE